MIEIDPFVRKRLAPTAYQLTPHRLRFRNDDEEGLGPDEIIVRLDKDRKRSLRPGEYAVISPREKFKLAEGLVVDFYPSSWCAERYLVLTAGRLDAHYDADLVFGLYNAGSIDIELRDDVQIARASFGWLGKNNIPSYSGPQPGEYIPYLKELRAREKQINSTKEQLHKQLEQVSKLREQLITDRMNLE